MPNFSDVPQPHGEEVGRGNQRCDGHIAKGADRVRHKQLIPRRYGESQRPP
jgi:hypothetical protein